MSLPVGGALGRAGVLLGAPHPRERQPHRAALSQAADSQASDRALSGPTIDLHMHAMHRAEPVNCASPRIVSDLSLARPIATLSRDQRHCAAFGSRDAAPVQHAGAKLVL